MSLIRVLITYSTFLLLFFFSSCMKELDEVSWDTSIVTPIAKTSLSMSDVIEDTTNIKTDINNHLILVYRRPIYTYSNPLDSLVDIKIRPLIKDVTLESLELSSQTFGSSITLGDILDNDPLYKLFFPDKSTIPNTFQGTTFSPSIDPIEIDISNLLQTAILTQGSLELELINQLPLDLISLDFIIKNTLSNTQIYSGTYSLDSKSSIKDNIDLAASLNGQPIEGQITVEIANISAQTPPNESTLYIDYSDYFSASIKLDSLKVSEATAIFPAQNLVEARDTVSLLDMGDIELTRAKIKKGKVSAVVRSTVEANMEMEYYIPSAKLNGEIFNFLAEVPAAPPGGFYEFSEEFPYDNYDFDFTGKDGTLTNTFYNELYARIDSTGELIHLSLDDTLSMKILVDEMIPSYVEGYFGQQALSIPTDTVTIDFFNSIKGGTIEFKDAKLNLVVENGLGINANLTFNSLKGLNTKTNQSYTFPTLPPFDISEATNLQTGFISSTNSLELPNVTNLLNILPNLIIYDISGTLNPNGNSPAYNDFIYESSALNAYLDLEIPLELKATNLVMVDTIEFKENAIARPEEIQSGVIRFITNNSFPFDADIKTYFLNSNLSIIDSLIGKETIKSAIYTNENSPYTPLETVLEFNVEQVKLQNILNATHIILEVTLNTSVSDYSKIYSQSAIDVQVTADFKYNVKTDF